MCAADELSPKGFRTVIDIDLVGTYTLSSAGLQYLKKSKNPLIVNITATLQYKATPFQIHASAAKAGIDVVTQTLGIEWGSKYGIRVVGVAPGPIAGTEGGPTGRVFGGALKTTTVADQIPIARWGETHDIGHAVLYLATAGSYVNATNLVVDGGQWHGSTEQFRKYDKMLSMINASMRKKKAKKAKL